MNLVLFFMQKYATLRSISPILPEEKILGFISQGILTLHLNAIQFKYFSFSLSSYSNL